jgi:hypothetical protein
MDAFASSGTRDRVQHITARFPVNEMFVMFLSRGKLILTIEDFA